MYRPTKIHAYHTWKFEIKSHENFWTNNNPNNPPRACSNSHEWPVFHDVLLTFDFMKLLRSVLASCGDRQSGANLSSGLVSLSFHFCHEKQELLNEEPV